MKYFRLILTSPIFEGNSVKNLRAEILHFGSILLFIFPIILIFFNLAVGTKAEKSIAWILGFIAVAQILVQRMIRLGFVDAASLLLLIASWVAMTVISQKVEGVRDVAIIGYVLIILASGHLLGWRMATVFTFATIAAVWWLAYLETVGLIVPSLVNPNRIAIDLTVLFILIFLVVYYLNKTLTESLDSTQRELDECIRIEKILEVEQERLHLALDAAHVGTWESRSNSTQTCPPFTEITSAW